MIPSRRTTRTASGDRVGVGWLVLGVAAGWACRGLSAVAHRLGATAAERGEILAGDEFAVSRFGMRATRATTIAAHPEQVWPWLTQIGTGKAGWYSYDLLDNLGRPSAREVLPQWQRSTLATPPLP